jgi:hypothetical protein
VQAVNTPVDDTALRPDPQAAPPVQSEPDPEPVARGIDSIVVRDAPVGRAPTKLTPPPEAPVPEPEVTRTAVTHTVVPKNVTNFRRAPKAAPVDDSPGGEQGAAPA